MSATFQDFIPFYDYSKIETGIQSYFVGTGFFVAPPNDNDVTKEDWAPGADLVPIFTGFQAAVFQKNRPRVAIDLNNIMPSGVPPRQIPDSNNQLRTILWRATLNFNIVTEASYLKHSQLRASVAAVAAELAIFIPESATPSTVGVNHYLTHHAIGYVQDGGQSMAGDFEGDHYESFLTYNITFGWRYDKMPA